jgi:hypothetical protein
MSVPKSNSLWKLPCCVFNLPFIPPIYHDALTNSLSDHVRCEILRVRIPTSPSDDDVGPRPETGTQARQC